MVTDWKDDRLGGAFREWEAAAPRRITAWSAGSSADELIVEGCSLKGAVPCRRTRKNNIFSHDRGGIEGVSPSVPLKEGGASPRPGPLFRGLGHARGGVAGRPFI